MAREVEAGSSNPHGTIRRLVVIDANVDRLHGERIRQYFAHQGVKHNILTLPVSEAEKTMASVLTDAGTTLSGIARFVIPHVGYILLEGIWARVTRWPRGLGEPCSLPRFQQP